MSGTCENLATKAELAALRSEVLGALGIKIDKPERPEIINVSVTTAVGQIFPSIEDLKQKLGVLGAIALTALDLARQTQANVQELIRVWPEIKQMAFNAWNEALAASAKAKQALLEAGQAFQNSLKALAKAGSAFDKAVEAEKRAIAAELLAQECFKVIDKVRAKADLALAQSNEAIRKANTATELAIEGIKRANIAYVQANDAMKQANLAEAKATYAYAQANDAMRQANIAYDRATEAKSLGLEAKQLGQINRSNISNLQQENNDLKNGLQGLQLQRLRDTERGIQQSRKTDFDRLRTTQTIGGLETQLTRYQQLTNYQTGAINSVQNNVNQIAGSGGLSSKDKKTIQTLENNQNTFKNDLSTFKNDLSTFKVNDGLFANDLSTFKNDLSTFSQSTTQNLAQTNNRITNLETGLANVNTQTNNRLGALETAATALNNADIVFNTQLKSFGFIATNLNTGQIATDSRVGTLENGLATTNNRVGALETTTTNLSNIQTQQKGQIEELDVNSTKKLGEVQAALGGIGLAVGAIALQTGQIANQTAPAALATAAETGVCNSTRQGGCMQNALSPIRQGIDNGLTNMAGLGTIAAQNAANTLNILNLLNTVWSYLQTFGSLVTGKFEKLWEHRLVDRALAAANLAVTIHNAVMLSNNIFMTLGQAIDNIGELIGIKAPEGASTTITGAIGKTFESLAKSVIGAENYTTLSINFAKANRIYQASVNILDATTAMFYGVSEGLETIAKMGGKIGNAAKKSGLFIENSIDWFGERFSFKVGRLGGITRFLQGAQEIAESIEQISSSALEVVQNANEIKKEVDDLQKDIKDLEDKKKADENKSKTDSKQPATTDQDIIKPSPN